MSTANLTLEKPASPTYLDNEPPYKGWVENGICYPDSDGEPVAENKIHFYWITYINQSLETVFSDRDDVFIASDLLWYPVKGKPRKKIAPDALVVFGQPKGYQAAYLQWRNDDMPPQVVFEVLSPGNTDKEMIKKLKFYEEHGAKEYYIYTPDYTELKDIKEYQKKRFSKPRLDVWQFIDGHRKHDPDVTKWKSPLLGMSFTVGAEGLLIFDKEGKVIGDYSTILAEKETLKERADVAEERADVAEEQLQREKELNKQERKLKEAAEHELQRLKERLREAGISGE